MKKNYSFLVLFALLSFSLCIACKKDKDEPAERVKFLGNYTTNEVCSLTEPHIYQISIIEGVYINEVKINNFWDTFAHRVTATVSGTTMTIPSQDPDQDGLFIEGSGSIDVSKIPLELRLNYTVTDTTGASVSTCVCTQSVFIKL